MSNQQLYPLDPEVELNPFSEKPNGATTSVEEKAAAAKAPKRPRKDRKAYSSTGAKATLVESTEKQMLFPVRKPGSINFFRVCPDPDSRHHGAFVIDGGMDGFFLIREDVVAASTEVRRRVKEATLVTCVSHSGKFFVWPILHGNPRTANAAFKIVEMAETQWLRINWDSFAQSYNPELPNVADFPELAANPEPKWEPSGPEILDEAFADCSIDNVDSLAIKKLLRSSSK